MSAEYLFLFFYFVGWRKGEREREDLLNFEMHNYTVAYHIARCSRDKKKKVISYESVVLLFTLECTLTPYAKLC